LNGDLDVAGLFLQQSVPQSFQIGLDLTGPNPMLMLAAYHYRQLVDPGK
jgi:hypothetical protein